MGANTWHPTRTIGANTSVAHKASVSRSVLGRGCVVGEGAVIEGCFLWNNVTVGAGAVLRNALVCNNVVIGAKAVVNSNAVLACGVKIADGQVIKPNARVCLAEKVRSICD